MTLERVAPVFVLIHGNVTLFAECISVIIPFSTLPNNVILQFRMLLNNHLPVVTKLRKCLLFGDGLHGAVPLTLIEYRKTGRFQAIVDTLTNWHTLPDVSPSSVICFRKFTFLQHIVTDSNKDLKLFLSGESICSIAILHHLEHLCFRFDHNQTGVISMRE